MNQRVLEELQEMNVNELLRIRTEIARLIMLKQSMVFTKRSRLGLENE